MNFLDKIKSESYKKGMILSVLFNLIAKVLLFVLTLVIAHLFGSSIKTDIYFFIFNIAILFASLTGNVDVAVIIPTYLRIKTNENEEKGKLFLSFIFWFYTGIGLLFILFIGLFGTKFFQLLSKFSYAEVVLYKKYFLIGSSYFFFIVITNYLTTILSALKYFTVSMFVSVLNSIITLVLIYLLYKKFDVLSVLIAGGVAYFVTLIILLVVSISVVKIPVFTFKNVLTTNFYKNVLYTSIGQVATIASSYFPLFLLSGLEAGSISLLTYGKTLSDIPNTLITAQISNVAGIKLNEQAAKNDTEGVNQTFLRTSKFLIVILVPISCFMIMFSKQLLQLVYNNSNLSIQSIETSSKFMQFFSFNIFFIAINTMVARVNFAMQLIRQPLVFKLLYNFLLITSLVILCNFYGAYGYPYAAILMSILYIIGLSFINKKLIPFISYNSLLKYGINVFLINVVVIAVIFFTLQLFTLSYFFKLILAAIAYCIILLSINKLLRLNWDVVSYLRNV